MSILLPGRAMESLNPDHDVANQDVIWDLPDFHSNYARMHSYTYEFSRIFCAQRRKILARIQLGAPSETEVAKTLLKAIEIKNRGGGRFFGDLTWNHFSARN